MSMQPRDSQAGAEIEVAEKRRHPKPRKELSLCLTLAHGSGTCQLHIDYSSSGNAGLLSDMAYSGPTVGSVVGSVVDSWETELNFRKIYELFFSRNPSLQEGSDGSMATHL